MIKLQISTGNRMDKIQQYYYIYIAIMLQINHIGDEITFVHRE